MGIPQTTQAFGSRQATNAITPGLENDVREPKQTTDIPNIEDCRKYFNISVSIEPKCIAASRNTAVSEARAKGSSERDWCPLLSKKYRRSERLLRVLDPVVVSGCV